MNIDTYIDGSACIDAKFGCMYRCESLREFYPTVYKYKYEYMHIYIPTYMYINVYIYIYICIYIYIYMYICVYTYTYTDIHICIYRRMYDTNIIINVCMMHVSDIYISCTTFQPSRTADAQPRTSPLHTCKYIHVFT